MFSPHPRAVRVDDEQLTGGSSAAASAPLSKSSAVKQRGAYGLHGNKVERKRGAREESTRYQSFSPVSPTLHPIGGRRAVCARPESMTNESEPLVTSATCAPDVTLYAALTPGATPRFEFRPLYTPTDRDQFVKPAR